MTDQVTGDIGPDRADDKFAVKLKGNPEQIDQLLRQGEVDIGDHPHFTENRDGTAWLDMFLTQRQIESLREEAYEIQVGDNLSKMARQRLSEIGTGDRFDGGRIPPQGLGRKIQKHPGGKPDRGRR